jgi:hypothetical protein
MSRRDRGTVMRYCDLHLTLASSVGLRRLSSRCRTRQVSGAARRSRGVLAALPDVNAVAGRDEIVKKGEKGMFDPVSRFAGTWRRARII